MTNDMHIGVLAFPFGTHAAPLLTLVRRLAEALPAARFSFLNSSVSNVAISIEHLSESYGNIKGYDVWDGTPQGFAGSHFEAVGLFLKASPGNFEKVIDEAEREVGLKVSCLITDAFLWFAGDMADRKGVPWLAFWTAAACSLSAHIYTDKILQVVGSKGKEETETISFIPGLEAAHLSDLPAEIFYEQNPTPLALTINNMVQQLPSCTAMLLNSFEEIDPIITKDLESKFHNFLNIGPSILASPNPQNPEDKTGCLSWLEKQSRAEYVVYISFGTVIVPPPNELVALAEALEICQLPFLWSLKDEGRRFLPHGFLDRTSEQGKIVSWAPQLQVLAHKSVGVFVTHCGWNSILESVCSSVPMICRPFFGDQKLNGRMVQDCWKIGVRLKGGVFTKNETVEALNLLVLSEEGKKIRENVHLLKQKAGNAVKPDGSSTNNFNKLLEIIGA